MPYDIRPEPTDDERAALAAALRALGDERPSVYRSRWREDAIELDGDDAGDDGSPPQPRPRHRPTQA